MQIMQGTNGDGPRGFRLDPTQTSFVVLSSDPGVVQGAEGRRHVCG